MTKFIEAARFDDLPPGTGTCVTVAGRRVALFNVDGAIYAMEDSCLHQGESLGMGKVAGRVVTCSGHGRRYKITTGQTLHLTDHTIPTYAVKVVDGKIMVSLADRSKKDQP
jgi:nitrite reductase/ring-hydroxylating ferredoxin subunit